MLLAGPPGTGKVYLCLISYVLICLFTIKHVHFNQSVICTVRLVSFLYIFVFILW